MVSRVRIFAAVVALVLGASGVARADAVAPDATMIDLTGSIVTAGTTGGVADPVPLFVGSSGPVIFVFGMPGTGDVAANPSLQRPGASFGPMAGVRQVRVR
ncbi:hypothetical protein DBT54_09640 [Aerococcus loyolae]|uniref:Uncharacterized protein n=2 Tax=Aerococcus TaxID=1375 RepID=A0A329NVI7_9LACT|nr:hypothetical protein DBT54_09640 [Aerococcus loyolae]